MANRAVAVEDGKDVAVVEALLAADEETNMVEIMVETVAKETRLAVVMVEAVVLPLNRNTRPNPCAIGVG